jgi:YVTN family beta-propeller protein
VSVIDTDPSSATYNQVITTIPVGYYPTPVAASPEGDRVYVGNYDTVSVIDTTTNEVIATIPVPSDGCGQGCYNGVWDVAVSLPDGDVLYAAVGDGTVSKIDTNTYDIISTTPVGFWDGDMELSADGSRLYATDGVSDTVVVYDTATMQRVSTVDVGPNQQDYARNVAISPDGTRAYAVVLNGFVGDMTAPSTVSVIDTDPTSDTYNQEIARITVPDGAYDVAVSPDVTRVYVTHSDGKTVTVIDTGTNAVVDTFTTDDSAGSGTRAIAVGRDGTLYITDYDDNTLYINSFNTTV